MRTRLRPACLAGLAVAVLAMCGCVAPEPVAVPTPDASATPLFASDEEALAAATEAYARYVAVSDQILIDGGLKPERLLEVATQAVFEKQSEGYQIAFERGWRSTGGTVVDSVTLQDFASNAVEGTDIVTVYACIDVSKVDVVDASGASVVSDSRPDRSPYEASFDAVNGTSTKLVLSGEKIWTGENFC
jgi:hypothetical protein